MDYFSSSFYLRFTRCLFLEIFLVLINQKLLNGIHRRIFKVGIFTISEKFITIFLKNFGVLLANKSLSCSNFMWGIEMLANNFIEMLGKTIHLFNKYSFLFLEALAK